MLGQASVKRTRNQVYQLYPLSGVGFSLHFKHLKDISRIRVSFADLHFSSPKLKT